jgi:hypothetical protein
MGLLADAGGPNPSAPPLSGVRLWSYQKSNGGYHILQSSFADASLMYWFDNSSCNSRFLGKVIARDDTNFSTPSYLNIDSTWNPSDPNSIYQTNNNSNITPTARTYGVVFKWTYTGLDTTAVPGAEAASTTTALTPVANGVFVEDLVHAYDSTFDVTKFTCFSRGVSPQTGHKYMALVCGRNGYPNFPSYPPGNQLVWLAVLDLGNGLPLGSGGNMQVIAAAATWKNYTQRWSGFHSSQYDASDQVILWATQQMNGGGGAMGPYQVVNQAALASGDTSMTVDGEPRCPTADFHCPDGLNSTLYPAQAGDYIYWPDNGEISEISAKNSPTSWTITRGTTGTAARAHASGVTPYMLPSPWGNGTPDFVSNSFWNYNADPHGLSTTYMAADVHFFGAHDAQRGDMNVSVMADSRARLGSLASEVGQYPAFQINIKPDFTSGVFSLTNGNLYQKAPGVDQFLALPAQSWYDVFPFIGGGGMTVVNVTGNLYKYTFGDGFVWKPKILPYWGMFNLPPLLHDVSGPGASIGGTTGDANKLCVVSIAGECTGGSSVGDIYFNVTGLTSLGCTGNEAIPGSGDVCIWPTSMFAQGVNQFGLTPVPQSLVPDQVPIPPGYPTYNPTMSRQLIHGFFPVYRHQTETVISISPENDWLLYYPQWGWIYNTNNFPQPAWAAKVPAYPTIPSTPLNQFVPVSVTLPSSQYSYARVRFGYAENGAVSSFYCTQRPESCSTDIPSGTPSDPFSYLSETVTRKTCSSGCSINIPAVPGRVVYYVVDRVDSGGTVQWTGPMQVAAVP